uniref:Secreted protein n=1 Tax=Opuntia streptacantha TaxID=393608 RepID=A0A7C9DD89_OPUST
MLLLRHLVLLLHLHLHLHHTVHNPSPFALNYTLLFLYESPHPLFSKPPLVFPSLSLSLSPLKANSNVLLLIVILPTAVFSQHQSAPVRVRTEFAFLERGRLGYGNE